MSAPTTYPITEIYPCIQGEGVQAGRPMTLIRFHGCAVHCHFCDTPYTWRTDGEEVADPDFLPNDRVVRWTPDQIIETLPDPDVVPWVLLTGGEPAEQPLVPLLDALLDAHYLTALETSGTAHGHEGGYVDWITVSPKPRNPGGRPILPEVIQAAHEIRWLVGKYQDVLDLWIFIEKYHVSRHGAEVCIQPISLGMQATKLCVEACHEHGFRLSVQTQKYLQLR